MNKEIASGLLATEVSAAATGTGVAMGEEVTLLISSESLSIPKSNLS